MKNDGKNAGLQYFCDSYYYSYDEDTRCLKSNHWQSTASTVVLGASPNHLRLFCTTTCLISTLKLIRAVWGFATSAVRAVCGSCRWNPRLDLARIFSNRKALLECCLWTSSFLQAVWRRRSLVLWGGPEWSGYQHPTLVGQNQPKIESFLRKQNFFTFAHSCNAYYLLLL
jgi:hypothetical protein